MLAQLSINQKWKSECGSHVAGWDVEVGLRSRLAEDHRAGATVAALDFSAAQHLKLTRPLVHEALG